MAHLHKLGFMSTIFIDDTLLIASFELECKWHVKASLQLFERLWFVVHPVKSVLTPFHSITYLGFIVNSADMTITLIDEKKIKIQSFASQLLKEGVCSVSCMDLCDIELWRKTKCEGIDEKWWLRIPCTVIAGALSRTAVVERQYSVFS